MAWFHTCDAGTLARACKTYVDDAACADALTDGGAASFCALSGTTFADNAKRMVSLFCGGIVADAGDGG